MIAEIGTIGRECNWISTRSVKSEDENSSKNAQNPLNSHLCKYRGCIEKWTISQCLENYNCNKISYNYVSINTLASSGQSLKNPKNLIWKKKRHVEWPLQT